MQYLPNIEPGAMLNPNDGSPEGSKKATPRDPTGAVGAPPNLTKSPKSPGKPAPGMTALAPGFVPGNFDVICARGKAAKDHPGNRWFRSLIEEHIQEYSECESKLEKSFVVSKVLKRVRKASPQGGFVKEFQGGTYWEVGDRLSREKIGQTFRDMLHNQYKSSTKAKATRRRQRASVDDDAKPAAEEEKAPSAKPSPQPTKLSATAAAEPSGSLKDDNPPRKKAKTALSSSPTALSSSPTDAMATLAAASASASSSSSDHHQQQAQRFSLSSLAAAATNNPMMGMSMGMGYNDGGLPQQFPPLPNLNRCMGGPLPQGPSAAAAAAATSRSAALLLNQRVLQNERQLQLQQQQLQQQQQQLQQQQQQFLRQQQFAATRNAAASGGLGAPGGELDQPSVPFNESMTMNSAALPSTSFGASFGEAIDEMYQGQLFSSDHTLESNSSGSMPKLPPSNQEKSKKDDEA